MTQSSAIPSNDQSGLNGPGQRLRRQHGLSAQLDWFVRLRWLAAGATVGGALVDWQWLGWLGRPGMVLLIGIVILGYNMLLWGVMRAMTGPVADTGRWRRVGLFPSRLVAPPGVVRGGRRRRWLLGLAWVQLLMDLACLTGLVLLTGALRSPLVGFYVFHMVFASLLLPRRTGYAGASLAWFILAGGLAMTAQWPQDHPDRLFLAGLLVTLLLTVYLADHLTLGLRRQRQHLIRQNRRIRAMAGQLRQHQQAMIQHEKMVAMGHMAAGVTHEIANPLASIDGLLQLAQRKPERLGLNMVQTLREQVERINRIIQQMKTFARPAQMQPQTVPLNRLVEQALEMLRFDRRLADVQVDMQLSPDAGQITVLPLALEQVLVNLIQNALDAMSEVAHPRLILRTGRKQEQCVIEVMDNGHGIHPEYLGRLFEPFFTTKSVGQGTGLGLSISYSLVQKLGGSIGVRSRPGEGTNFTIRLPLNGRSERAEAGTEGPQ